VLKSTTLPGHFSPHCLRHTYASFLLQTGESPAYVQRQLGHAAIQLTVDTYGRWLPLGNKAAVDQLDTPRERGAMPTLPVVPDVPPDPSGSKVVAAGGSRRAKSSAPRLIRTADLLIRSGRPRRTIRLHLAHPGAVARFTTTMTPGEAR